MKLPPWYLGAAAQMYEEHGIFPNGKPFDEQSEEFWQELTTMRRLVVHQMQELSGKPKDGTGDWQVLETDDEPQAMTDADREAPQVVSAEPELVPLTIGML